MRTDSLRLRLQPEEREQLMAFLRTLWVGGRRFANPRERKVAIA